MTDPAAQTLKLVSQPLQVAVHHEKLLILRKCKHQAIRGWTSCQLLLDSHNDLKEASS